ncbi:acyl carrier protein [Escherichia coli]|uniref:acyl carrier protein n=1 Tax=Escherichia coli TaxID=562 RepID=UPI002FCD0EAC
MVNREIVMDYILSCLQDLVENGVEIKPDSDLVNDLGLESIKVMDLLMMLEDRFDISIPINILLDVKTPAQLMETLLPGNDSNLLIVFYVQIMPDDFVMQLHRF